MEQYYGSDEEIATVILQPPNGIILIHVSSQLFKQWSDSQKKYFPTILQHVIRDGKFTGIVRYDDINDIQLRNGIHFKYC